MKSRAENKFQVVAATTTNIPAETYSYSTPTKSITKEEPVKARSMEEPIIPEQPKTDRQSRFSRAKKGKE